MLQRIDDYFVRCGARTGKPSLDLINAGSDKNTHSKPLSPRRPGTWPDTMLSADPVMKPLTAGAGMNSTSHPKRNRPMARTINPQMNATVVAICGCDHSSGCASVTCLMIWATVRDITATGPIETSFEVAKNWGRSADFSLHFLTIRGYNVSPFALPIQVTKT